MRFGYELFSPIILPPGKQGLSAAPRYITGINPLDTISSKDTRMEDWQGREEQQAKYEHAFTIGANGCIEIVRSPYSNLMGDAYLTSYELKSNDFTPVNLYKGLSFYDILPSSTISQSEIIFDENPLGFTISNANSFHEACTHYSGDTDPPAATANMCTPTITLPTKERTNDVSFLDRYNTIFDEEVKSEMGVWKEEESGFSVESSEVMEMNNNAEQVKDNSIKKKTRKNYNSNTTNILMNWFFQHNGKAPSNQIRNELAMKTGKSVIQSEYFIYCQKLNFVLMSVANSFDMVSKRQTPLHANPEKVPAAF
ncbi:hypothetical protein [Parasitella parasitica]|uniref:Uncharacterized protein n=1 Tax=Parasitella parasitica TaxID=35722 RepID=A0A0B7N6H9_9FUNG|nr:hypothetical protein [Parasitella parasitica]